MGQGKGIRMEEGGQLKMNVNDLKNLGKMKEKKEERRNESGKDMINGSCEKEEVAVFQDLFVVSS